VSGRGSDARRAAPPLVVEVAGPPGSGKTTLARALAALLPSARLVTGYKSPRGALVYLGAALGALPAILARPRGVPRPWRQLNWMVRLAASPGVLRRAGPEPVVVVDQGPVYTLARLDEAAGDRPGRRRYERWRTRAIRRAARAVDLVVLLDASAESLLERIRGRPKDHAAKPLDEPRARQLVERGRAFVRAAAAAVVEAGGPRLVVLDTSRTDPAAAARVVDEIRRAPARAARGA
jgi:cytidylate kinase